MKFYTDDGIWDLTGNNTPIFFIRDPLFFPSFIHTQKRNPVTHLKDANMFWDFISLRAESSHQVCSVVFSSMQSVCVCDCVCVCVRASVCLSESNVHSFAVISLENCYT